MWFSPYHQEHGAIHSNESDAMLAGRLVADVASAAIAAAEFSAGVGGEGGGILACATGVGCPGGAATMMAGAVLITQAAGTGARAAEGAGTTLAMFSKRDNRGIRQVDSVANELGITGKDRKEFGKYIEKEKEQGASDNANWKHDFSYGRLREIGLEFLKMIRKIKE
jgi:hypothetical protein